MDHTFLLIPDVYDGLKCMKFLEIPPTNETLREYIIPNLLKHSKKETPENTLEKLSSYTGVSLTVIVPAAIQHLLSENDSQSVARFGMFPHDLTASPEVWQPRLMCSLIHFQHRSTVFDLVAHSLGGQ
jgi:hypothetical protein